MNRTIALFAIWSTAILIMNHLQKKAVLQRNLHIIDQNVKVAQFSSTGIITDISNALCRYLGVTKDSMIGTQSNFFHSEISEQDLQEIWVILRSGKNWAGELRCLTSTGELKWAYSSIHPVFDSQVNIISYNNFLTDITDKKLLEKISLTDPLTSLPNRRSFDETLPRGIKLARREQWPITLAIIDIDFFKNYNDFYGHPEGDMALINVANTLKHVLRRPGDHVCRIGGEEFALFFSQVEHQESEGFLEKIRESVEALQIPHEKSEVNQFLTISIGAHICTEGKAIPSKEEFIKKADIALYAAKEKRNCVVLVD